ncbi:autotransporter domain-containing protein [Campylobacter upsaliensis RM3940]|uniref:autotransporter outer membrane beta-barrel domain-containing protein n=3 Tax=Campylobacter upsaliensis TaxID=28080 RepID=UPI0015939C30|nr:autotransporter outer membrane beta-barrel domain-containing protein [Campylobacter upsaliensis]QKF87816.1 autotransporter domain-containing protein [Campylobacter upsaliensis RM3940]
MQKHLINSLAGGGGDTMLSYNQQGIQSRLIPSFLALSVITALHSPLQAAWVINKSDSQQETQHIDTTISNNIILNNRNTAIYTDRNGAQLGQLTINEGVTIQVNKANGKGIEINTGNGGTQVNNITNNGSINTKGTGIFINDRSSAETITVGANGSITSADGNAIYVGNGSRVNHIDIQGATTGSGGIINRGTIGVQTTTQPNGIKVTGSITSKNNRAAAIENTGTINGGINVEGTLTGGTSSSYWGFHTSILNYKTINGGIKVGENATLNGGILNVQLNNGPASITGDITVDGTINMNGRGSAINNGYMGTVNGNIIIGENGKLGGNIWNQNRITGKVEVKGTLTGEIRNRNNGSMIKQGIIVSGGTITNGIKNEGTVKQNIKVENSGNLQGQGIVNQGKVEGNVQIQGSNVTNIQNTGTVTQKIELTQNSTIQGSITNTNTINGIDIANSQIGGNIVNSGSNANTGAINITGTSDIKGSIVNQNGATFTNNITLDQSSKLGGISNNANSTMSGTLDLKGEVGTITNAGKFDSTLTLSNKVGQINNAEGGTITNDITINNGGSVGAINNSGTMQAITNNATTGTLTLTNSGGTIDKITNGNGATATIRNQGTITNGIINDGGTLTVFNDFRKDESAANGYHTIGEIGKTANGVHIENNNGGKLHLNAWYFNKEDFTTQEERKANSLLVSGNYADITLGDVFVNTQGLDVDKTYNANTFIADKDGNAVGGQINNGQGIDVNKLHSVSGIYKFENFGGNGQYRAIINRDELSGKTLAQSIIYSQRVRNVNLSRILREATTQVFVSGKEGEVNGKSLSQLEQLHTNHRDQNSQNHTFVIPYYQNFSADLGSDAKLKSNSSGMLIATQRELPNDYGVLGIYTGFENAEQKVNAQRLDLDGNSYYAGLTYNHSFYEDDLTTYFMNLTTKLDYIERDVTKTYLGYIGSASSTAKVFGYGANARVGLSHYLKNDAKITPQIGFNYLGMHSKPFTLNHLGGTREHYYSQNFNFIDAVATIKYETPWINRFKTSLALGTIINVYKDAEGTLHLDNNFLSSELDIARLYGVVQGGISYDLTKDSDISLGYSGIFSSANTIRSHTFMFRYAWWW